jgi:hypothetical protein
MKQNALCIFSNQILTTNKENYVIFGAAAVVDVVVGFLSCGNCPIQGIYCLTGTGTVHNLIKR